jgi:hypothetical protein
MRPHAQPWSGPEEPPFADQFSALSLASSWRPTAAPPPPPPRPAPPVAADEALNPFAAARPQDGGRAGRRKRRDTSSLNV